MLACSACPYKMAHARPFWLKHRMHSHSAVAVYLHGVSPSSTSPTASRAACAPRLKGAVAVGCELKHRYPLICPVAGRPVFGHAHGSPSPDTCCPGRVPRVGIIEIPHLSPRWVEGVGGGVHRGRPGPETSAWTSLDPWSPCRLVQSVWLRILGLLSLAGPYGPHYRQEKFPSVIWTRVQLEDLLIISLSG